MPLPKEYIFFCDESLRRGPFFSNFYGGVRVSSADFERVNGRLTEKKRALGLTSEVKWQKADLYLADRYKEMMSAFFEEIQNGSLAVRIMFTQNIHEATGLSPEQHANEYFILYYQFLKHAFGLAEMPEHATPPRIRIYLDEIGETREKVATFRGFIAGLSSMRTANPSGFILEQSDITEVRSHDHVLMQCLDVVLGAMCFRLNNMHREIPEGKKRRGKRTVGKERLYNHIRSLVCRVTDKKYFNIGISTGQFATGFNRWSAPYSHWRFVPTVHRIDKSKSKP